MFSSSSMSINSKRQRKTSLATRLTSWFHILPISSTRIRSYLLCIKKTLIQITSRRRRNRSMWPLLSSRELSPNSKKRTSPFRSIGSSRKQKLGTLLQGPCNKDRAGSQYKNVTDCAQITKNQKGLQTEICNPLILLVRLAGIEPTTPWFVVNYFSVQDRSIPFIEYIKITIYQ
jgi:hypothetical protein